MMSAKHEHKHDHCEHKNIAYCKQCAVVHCKDCGREWLDNPPATVVYPITIGPYKPSPWVWPSGTWCGGYSGKDSAGLVTTEVQFNLGSDSVSAATHDSNSAWYPRGCPHVS